MNVMHCLGASNMTIGQDDECDAESRLEDLDTNGPDECPTDGGHRDVTEKKKNDKSKSYPECQRKTIVVSGPSCSGSSFDVKMDQNVLNKLIDTVCELQTDVANLRTDYERQMLRRSSVGAFAYTQNESDTMDDGLRILESGLHRLQLKASCSARDKEEVQKMTSLFEHYLKDYELIKSMHDNVRIRAKLARKLRKRRLEQESISCRRKDGRAGSWMADNICRPCRALYRWIFGSPTKTRRIG